MKMFFVILMCLMPCITYGQDIYVPGTPVSVDAVIRKNDDMMILGFNKSLMDYGCVANPILFRNMAQCERIAKKYEEAGWKVKYTIQKNFVPVEWQVNIFFQIWSDK